MGRRSAHRGPARIVDWTLEQKASVYRQLVAFVPAEIVDAAHARALASLPATYQRLAADHLVLGDEYSRVTYLDDLSWLARRLREQIVAGEQLPVVGWLAIVADGFFDDFWVQHYLSLTVRVPGTPDPPLWAENWIWTLPDHPAPAGTWDRGYPFMLGGYD